MYQENPVSYLLHYWAYQDAAEAFIQAFIVAALIAGLLKMHAKASVNAYIRSKRKANPYPNQLKNLNK